MTTYLRQVMNMDTLAEMIDGKFIKVTEHPVEAGLRILNYTEKAVYDKVWNGCTEQCRGLIIDENDMIIARPWRKFWNYGERPVAIGTMDTVEITDKMDGSLGIAYYYRTELDEFQLAIATRGSFLSDQAKFATAWLDDTYPNWQPVQPCTPLFEIVYPENRIVLDYGDFEGLILLGAVDIGYGYYYGPGEAAGMLQWPGRVTQTFPYRTLAGFMSSKDTQRHNAEGVVVRSGQTQIKIKQEDYCRLHALVTGLTNRRVWETLASEDDFEEAIAALPDEFHKWAVSVAGDLIEQHATWLLEAAQEYQRVHQNAAHMDAFSGSLLTRKTFASVACKSPLSAALFKLFDNQSIDGMAWAAVRPTEIKRPYGGMDNG